MMDRASPRARAALAAAALALAAARSSPADPASAPSAAALPAPAGPRAGLYDEAGLPRPIRRPAPAAGRSLDVTAAPFLADRGGKADARPAIEAALAAARPGDELYFPEGTYLLASPSSADRRANILLKCGVSLRGQSREGTILRTSFDEAYSARKPAGSNRYVAVLGSGVSELAISSLTLSSTWTGELSLDATRNNPGHGGPNNQLRLEAGGGRPCERVLVEDVAVERFINIGIRVDRGCREVLVSRCVARLATDLGGGGCGYGFQLSGKPDNSLDNSERYANPNLGTLDDSCYNAILECRSEGPYIRHAALIQYWAHHNLVSGCSFEGTALDSIDLHGEDEYANEISGNTVRGCRGGAAIGLGNSGGTSVVHDKSGPGNLVAGNEILDCLQGISVRYGSPGTVIRGNRIRGCSRPRGIGILLGFAPGTAVEGNLIEGNPGEGFVGIALARDKAEGHSRAGAPSACSIRENRVFDNPRGRAFAVYAEEGGNRFAGNLSSGNADDRLPPEAGGP
ncbi:MAG TPA: right-handed parallel beta-helix repeat-containing protein [Spirochaetia bacterium]|nr:right-handed parallel beta-helix repeat-containing protein [Spirochaetia bacterium]